MKKIVLFSLFTFSFVFVNAQEWVNLLQDPDANFYDVKAAFEEEWEGREYERGKGYKQYKRWEYFMEPRVYPSGVRPDGKLLYKGSLDAKLLPKIEAKSETPWEPVGPVSWTSQGWNPGLGRINAIVVDPQNSSKIFVATPSGGLWVSTDNGSSWSCLTDNLPAIGASGLAIDPTNSDVMYLATGDGNGADTYSLGVLKSIDGGETWEPTGLSFEVNQIIRCTDIEISPTDPDKILVSTNNGLFVTSNGGTTWSQPIMQFVRDIEFKPENPEIIYVSGRSFFRSANGGLDFTTISTGVPNSGAVNRLEIAVTPANPELVYMVAGDEQDSGFQGFYRSTDSGNSFTLMSDSPNILGYSQIGDSEGGQSWYDLAIDASPTNENEVYVGGINVWRTNDGGSTWNIKSHWIYPSNIGYTHADIHSLDFFGNTLYCGSDGGIFRSTNGGNSWTDLSEGLQISQYYKISVSTTDANKILAGSQDNGTNLFSGESNYLHLLGGDGNGATIDYSNDQIMYASYPGGSYQRSTNGGNSFTSFTEGIDETGAWVTPFQIHPSNPSILYAAYENVWKYENNTWSPISDIASGVTLRAMKVAPSDPNTIYVSSFSQILKTTNGGQSWSSVVGNLPDLFITAIEVDPQDPDRVWITLSGYEEGQKVYFSSSGGGNWVNLSGNLPNVPANCIHYLQGSQDGIYVGTDVGIFYRDSELDNWSSYNEGLPNVIINQLVFHYGTQQIFAGTYGRGIWKNNFFDITNLEPVINFSSSNPIVCPGGEVEFQDQSVNVTSGLEWTFEGGVPETSNESNPVVTYLNGGTYEVKLKGFNGELGDSVMVADYITVLNGVNPPYSEDFEDAEAVAEQWFFDPPSQVSGWELNTEVGYNSSASVWIENGMNPSGTEDIFTSQNFDLSELDTAFITMRVAYAPSPGSGFEALRVYISTDCDDNWTFKKIFSTIDESLVSAPENPGFFEPDGQSEWNYLVVDNIQPEERTQNFRFQLSFTSDEGNNIYIDDINLTNEIDVSSVSGNGNWSASTSLFPNPTTSDSWLEINLVQPEVVRLRILDETGRLVKNVQSGQMNTGKNQIDLPLEALAPGVYFVEIVGESGSRTEKLILTKE